MPRRLPKRTDQPTGETPQRAPRPKAERPSQPAREPRPARETSGGGVRGSLRRKLSLSFAVVQLLLLLLGGGAGWTIRQIGLQTAAIKEEAMKALSDASGMKTVVADLRRYFMEISATRGDAGDTGLPGGEEDIVAARVQEFDGFYQGAITYLQRRGDDEGVRSLEAIDQSFPLFVDVGKAMAQSFIAGGPSDGQYELERFKAIDTRLMDGLNILEDSNRQALKDILDEVEKHAGWVSLMAWSFNIIAFILVLLLVKGLTRSIVDPLKSMSASVGRVSAGDLTQQVQNRRYQGEVAVLAQGFDQMVQSLSQMVGSIAETAADLQKVGVSTSEASRMGSDINMKVSNVMTELSQGAQSQTSSVEETRMAVQDASQLMATVVGNSRSVAQSTEQAMDVVNSGAQSAEDAVTRMQSIQENVEHSAEVVQRLGERTKRINHIVEMITAVAEQTNLLALNAAIEAARAGEHGQGFAVVADEVRKLAEQSTMSAQDIVKLIVEIQEESNQASATMREQSEVVDAGVRAVQNAGASFQRIREAVQDILTQTGEIRKATEEMATQNKRVVDAISDVSMVTQRTSASSQEVSDLTDELGTSVLAIAEESLRLEKMAQSLQEKVDQFKLKG